MKEKLYELAVVDWNGNPAHCVYLNDYRIAGGKPWGGYTRMRTFQVGIKDLTDAIPELRPKTDLLEAAQALGVMPEGYCFCSKDRIGDDSKVHEPECADLRAAIAKAVG